MYFEETDSFPKERFDRNLNQGRSMECRAYCTAPAYSIKTLYEDLKREGEQVTLYREVLHRTLSRNEEDVKDIFYFPYGVSVFWGVDLPECRAFLTEIQNFEEQHSDETDTDEFTFDFGSSSKIVEDEIILSDRRVLCRLAVSHGLAQSVKLGVFENAIRKTFKHMKHIPEDLAKHGKIALSRKEIRRKMGELFIERNSINLHLDVLDTPEFFWEHSELEPLYSMTANYLDIETRVEVLNQRLNIIHELFDMLGTELNHQHSGHLEWIIIILIVMEVVLTLLRDVFHLI